MRIRTSGEFRGSETKTSKIGNVYEILRFEDNTAKPFELVSNEKYNLTKGAEYDIECDLFIGSKYTSLQVLSINEL